MHVSHSNPNVKISSTSAPIDKIDNGSNEKHHLVLRTIFIQTTKTPSMQNYLKFYVVSSHGEGSGFWKGNIIPFRGYEGAPAPMPPGYTFLAPSTYA